MGWQDSLAKHHPIPAFFAAVISNLISSNKADHNESSTNGNLYNERSYSDNHEYGHSEIQPAQYYYPATPIPSSSSLNKPKKNKNKTYNEDHQTDYYYNPNNDKQIVKKSKGFWGRRDEHVVEKTRGYGVKGTVTRTFMDPNGEEVMEERDYQYQSYYELQLSPARMVETRKKNGSYQGAGRSRYN